MLGKLNAHLAEKQPQPRRLRGGFQRLRSDHRHGVSGSRNRLPYAQSDRHHQAAHDKYVGNRKTTPVSRTPPKLTRVMNHQAGHAKCQCVRLQRGNRRVEGAYAGRYAQRHHKHLIDHQRGCREQAYFAAEVFARHRKGTAARRIRRDRLQRGEHTITSSTIMLKLMGTMWWIPAAPSGISSVSAASGP